MRVSSGGSVHLCCVIFAFQLTFCDLRGPDDSAIFGRFLRIFFQLRAVESNFVATSLLLTGF